MAEHSQYVVVLTGKAVEGFELGEVKRNVGRLFKLNDSQVEQLFPGKPVAVRRGLNKEQVVKLRNALKKAGAETAVRASAASSSDAGKKPAVAAPKPKVASAARAKTAAVRKETVGEVKTIDCYRCGHHQPFATTCTRCGMDLRLQIKRMERKQQMIEFRRQQSGVS